MQGALADVVAVECGAGAAVAYAGRLLSDLGAQVIKVEPPGGDPMRAGPVMVEGESAVFAWLNAGKLGVEMGNDDPRLPAILAHADIVFHSTRGDAADAFEAAVKATNPRAVILSLTPYGRSGERAAWKTTPFTEWATSGYFYIAGDPAREPLALPGHQAEMHAGLHGAIAALSALWHARQSGEGQRIEVSHQEAVLNDHAWLTTSWTHEGNVQRRTGSLYAKCADGFVYLFNLAVYPNLFVLIDRHDLLENEALQTPAGWWENFPTIFAALEEWTATRTKAEIYHAAQELRIAISPVNTIEDVVGNAQLVARDWFRTVEAGGQNLRGPGFPYRLTGTPCENHGPAPSPGQHTGPVCHPEFRWANAAVPAPQQPGAPARSGPLAGLRVIECTAHWAGPIGGRHFADLGADVIKVELQTKPATRSLVPIAGELWPEHYHRSGYFNKLTRNKRAICLDLAKPAGRETFLKLVAESDVLIENNAVRVMGQLGLDFESLRAVNPGLVMCSLSGYGATGPERNYSAFGSNIETVSGLASILGYGPGEFFGTGSFYADPLAGNHAAVAVLAALHSRRRTGQGQWIDLSLLEAALPFFAEPILQHAATGDTPEPSGDRWGAGLFGGTFRSAGTDCWLAVSCFSPTEVAALGTAIGAPALFASGRPAEGAREAFAAWARALDHNAAAERLQAVGVPAAPIMANWELFTDNHLNDRDFFLRVRHPRAGTLHYPGFAWRLESTPAALHRPAPLFAEHNHDVFSGLLGLTEAEIAGLYAAGITGDEPVYAAGPSL